MKLKRSQRRSTDSAEIQMLKESCIKFLSSWIEVNKADTLRGLRQDNTIDGREWNGIDAWDCELATETGEKLLMRRDIYDKLHRKSRE